MYPLFIVKPVIGENVEKLIPCSLLAIFMFLLTACGGSSSPTPEQQIPDSPVSDLPVPNPPAPNPSLPSQPVEPKPAPVGMYHSGGLLNGAGLPVVQTSINGLGHVAGTLIRPTWSQIHIEPGVFDFSLLDREFAEAEKLGTQIALMINDAKDMPAFVQAACETFDYSFRGEPVTTCLPWDSNYQAYKQELLSELGARYDTNEHLAAVYMSYAAMTNGAEMHWRVDESEFAAAGYTQDRLVSAYNAVMDMYIAAFTSTPIVMEVHEVFDDGFLAERGFEHCYQQIGERCGVAIWWCAERMTKAPGGESDVWPTALAATNMSFAICQTVGNFTEQPERFDEGAGWTSLEALQNEMSFFQGQGFAAWELWTKDITNEEFFDTINSVNNTLIP